MILVDYRLVSFVNDRLTELEQMARALGGAELMIQSKGGFHEGMVVREFLEAHNPPQMLARVQAGRDLVRWSTDDTIDISDESGFAEWFQVPLRCFAAQWRNHAAWESRWDEQ